MSEEDKARFVIEVRGNHNVLVRREGNATDPNPATSPRTHKLNEAIEDALSDCVITGGEVDDDYREELYADESNIPHLD